MLIAFKEAKIKLTQNLNTGRMWTALLHCFEDALEQNQKLTSLSQPF